MARKTAWRGSAPDPMVVLVGPDSTWSEAVGKSRKDDPPASFVGAGRCPNGCSNRDLEYERRRRLKRLCLRCLTYTYDPPGWAMPVPLQVVVKEAKERRELARRTSLAYRKFHGRKAARRAALPP